MNRHFHMKLSPANKQEDEYEFNRLTDEILTKVMDLFAAESRIEYHLEILILEPEDKNGIFKDPDGYWYWDECGIDKHGPFDIKEKAKANLDAYVKHLNKEDI